MLPTSPQAREWTCKVKDVTWFADDCYAVFIDPQSTASEVLPGQFFMLRRPDGDWPLLPRPFSIYRIWDGSWGFLVKPIGPGTSALGRVKPGDTVMATGPLGTPFPEVTSGVGVTILAGGIGVAPFPHVVERALSRGVPREEMALVFGSRTSGMLYDLPRFQHLGIATHLATDDGSAGHRGNAVELLRKQLDAHRIPSARPIFVCGPERMLEAAAHLASERKLKMYLSLETYMACGIGVCNGCSVPVHPEKFEGWPYAKACREGPTFESSCLRI